MINAPYTREGAEPLSPPMTTFSSLLNSPCVFVHIFGLFGLMLLCSINAICCVCVTKSHLFRAQAAAVMTLLGQWESASSAH